MQAKKFLRCKWFALCVLNNFVIILGVHLPFNFPCFKLKLRKISIVVFFITICSAIISLNTVKRLENRKYTGYHQIYIIICTSCSSMVLVNRFRYFLTAHRCYSIILRISSVYVKPFLKIKDDWKEILKNNSKLLLMIVLFLVTMGNSLYTKKSIHCHVIHQYLSYAILIFDSLLIIWTLDIMIIISKILMADLKMIYKDFHRIPPAELSKSGNGDLILVGWISEIMDFNIKKDALSRLQELSKNFVFLQRSVDDFNVAFESSVICLVLMFLTNFWSSVWLLFNDLSDGYKTVFSDFFELFYILVGNNCVYFILFYINIRFSRYV